MKFFIISLFLLFSFLSKASNHGDLSFVKDSAIINKEKYVVYKSNKDTIRIYNTKGLIFLTHFANSSVFFKDYNQDGYKDLVIYIGGQVVTQEVFLYVKEMKNFKRIQHLVKMHNVAPLQGTKYFYSLQDIACDGNYWESVLFKIKNFSLEFMAIITAKTNCDQIKDQTETIYINKIVNSQPELYEQFSRDSIKSFKLGKWDYISNYWSKNYKNFVPTTK